MYKVEVTVAAKKFFEKADAPLQRRLDRCFDRLSEDPRDHNMSKPLRGPRHAGRHRFRVGDWRVIYRIDDDAEKVHVLRIAHRREVYE